MSGGTQVDYDALAKQAGAINQGGSTPAPSQPQMTNAGVDYDALAAKSGAVNQVSSGAGQEKNDVGATVIVPKEGESFQDTMKRAAAYGKTAQAQADVAKETTAKNLAEKTGETLAAAPFVGAAGTAALAGAGEAGAAALPHTIEGVKAIGSWAADHPVQAYIAYHVLRELVPGMKKAMGIVQHSPDAQ